MNCLYCGKPLPANDADIGWHKACIKHFFGTRDIPELDISGAALERLAIESVNKGFTVTGAQKKLSLHLVSADSPRLTLVDYPTGYILKPQTEEYPAMPESEHLVMRMAEVCGIQTVPCALMKINNEFSYITKRVDRIIEHGTSPGMLAMEDFCQLDLRLSQDKYKGSYERCSKIIWKYSSRQGFDLTELYLRLAFSFLIGNSDMHLKNFSLIETSVGSNQYTLSPAYDLLPVNIIMPEDTEEFALTMNGKKKNLHRKDFLTFAETSGLSRKPAEKILDKMISMQSRLEAMIAESLLPGKLKEAFLNLLSSRVATIQ